MERCHNKTLTDDNFLRLKADEIKKRQKRVTKYHSAYEGNYLQTLQTWIAEGAVTVEDRQLLPGEEPELDYVAAIKEQKDFDVCRLCSDPVPEATKAAYQKHFAIKHSRKRFKCSVCSEFLSVSLGQMKDHKMKAHGIELSGCKAGFNFGQLSLLSSKKLAQHFTVVGYNWLTIW